MYNAKGPGSKELYDIATSDGQISNVTPHDTLAAHDRYASTNAAGGLVAPSLCHPHIHIDKAYLLSHPKYAHLQIERGDFAEAMELTGDAKAQFEDWDLLERGRRVIDESVAAGVTHMRAFVEVDSVVGMKCLEAGIQLKREAETQGRCYIQLCAFAQLPLFSGKSGDRIFDLMHAAAGMTDVDVLGSTPYVEPDLDRMRLNIDTMIDWSIEFNKHLDFHLDYNLDSETEPLIWYLLQQLKSKNWEHHTRSMKTVVLGHCTRLTLFSDDEWTKLKAAINGMPISFVGLPTSDMFMMRTPERARGTLDVPRLIKKGFNACLGINNIGNAFTPHGSCDPLTLACNGVAIYQAGTRHDANILYECVSTRARKAIGLHDRDDTSLSIQAGRPAHLVVFGKESEDWRSRKEISEVVYLYDHCRNRRALLGGVPTS